MVGIKLCSLQERLSGDITRFERALTDSGMEKVRFCLYFSWMWPLGLAPVNIYEIPYLNPEPASGQFVSFILREESYGGFTIGIYDRSPIGYDAGT
jgi:hypothetical protein